MIHKLYADAGINFYYFIMSVIGWINWTSKKEEKYVYPISFCSKKEWVIGLGFFFGSLLILLLILSKTDSNTVVGDSLVSSSAITAMWWMANRKIESWYAWIFSNIIALPLFYSKGLHPTVVQYFIFTILAIWGLKTWIQIHSKENQALKA